MIKFLHMFMFFCLLGFTLLTASCTGNSGQAQNSTIGEVKAENRYPEGVYALFKANKNFDTRIVDSVLKSGLIDGVTLRTWWHKVEPQPNNYDWSYLEEQIQIAKSHSLKTKIIILTGAVTPKWVYEEFQAQSVYLDIKKKGMKQIQFPVPWDVQYQKRLAVFSKAVFDHFENESSVTGITIGGPGAMSAEMHMPKNWSFCPDGQNESCVTKERWVQSWKNTIDLFGQAANRIPFGVGISRPFGEESLQWMDEVLEYATAKGSNFFIQYNGLKENMRNVSDRYCYEKISHYNGIIPTGFQTVWSFSKRPEIGNVGAVFELAKEARVDFVEIYAIDIANKRTAASVEAGRLKLLN